MTTEKITGLKRQIAGWELELEERREQSEADSLQGSIARRQLKKLIGAQEIDGADHTAAIAELRAQIAQIAQREETFPTVEGELERRIREAKHAIEQINAQAELDELEQLKQEALTLRKQRLEAHIGLAEAELAERQNQHRRGELRRAIFERHKNGRGMAQLPDWGDLPAISFDWRTLGSPEAVAQARRLLQEL